MQQPGREVQEIFQQQGARRQTELESFLYRHLIELAGAPPLAVVALHRLAALSRPAGASGTALPPKQWAQLLWALARLSRPLPPGAVAAAAARAPQLVPQNVANVLWAFATARVGSEGAAPLAAEEALRRGWEGFGTQSISNVLWAVGARGPCAAPWMEALGQGLAGGRHGRAVAGGHRWEEFGTHELCSIVWAFATAAVDGAPLLAPIVRELPRRQLGSFHAQEVAGLLWALSALRQSAWQALEAAGVQRAPELAPQSLASIAWAAATARASAAPGGTAGPLLQAVSAEAVRRGMAEWTVRSVVNTVWAVAAASARDVPGLVGAALEALRAAREDELWTARHIPSVAWALAVLPARDAELLVTCGEAAMVRAPELQLRGLANVAWSRAALRLPDEALARALARSALGRLAAELPAALAAAEVPGAAPILAVSLAEITWSFCTLRFDFGVPGAAREALLALGQRMDAAAAPVCGPALALGSPAEWPLGAGSEPKVVRQGPGWCVLLKPPGWEVDTSETDRALTLRRGRRPLSAFLRRVSGAAPLSGRRDLDFGFLHRLDTPSSGLIVAALSFEALFHLRWVVATHGMSRDYLVLCHGAVADPGLRLDFPVRVDGAGPSVVADDGQPALTHVRLLGHFGPPVALADGPSLASYSLCVCSIETGRRHQIRAHMTHAGHPLVCDGRYALERLHEDQRFLHRFRLHWDAAGTVEGPLPRDLRAALAALRPADARAAAAVRGILSGALPRGAGPAGCGALGGEPHLRRSAAARNDNVQLLFELLVVEFLSSEQVVEVVWRARSDMQGGRRAGVDRERAAEAGLRQREGSAFAT
ncbi:unnamed protein product [Prorocentrum cordatum]|uniref:Pseudouridine synthase RsuA/RluA-like domain-containing protein n=1 Tax=Prorocentrum cordatum TaxID=2364126 RepID=A0ABN9P9Q8_9DINO|nr:unnamed protein product [Polarella glacialis]